ncbi:hypothetical protein DFQ30_003846, partial [Apophysomyces sp. BC1015]
MQDTNDDDYDSNDKMQNPNKDHRWNQMNERKRKRKVGIGDYDKETTRRKQRSMQAVLRKNLLAGMKADLTTDVINSHLDGDDLTTKEMDTMLLLYRNLHPF